MHRLRGRFNLCLDRFYLSLGGANLSLVDARLSGRVVGVRSRSNSAFQKVRLSRKLEPALLHVCLSLREIGASLFKLRLRLRVGRLIIRERTLDIAQLRIQIAMFQTSDYLTGFHSAPCIDAKIFEATRDLRTDGGLAIGDDVTRCGENLDAVA